MYASITVSYVSIVAAAENEIRYGVLFFSSVFGGNGEFELISLYCIFLLCLFHS